MSLGIGEFSNITMTNITRIANITEPADLYINVNTFIYGGWLIFFFMIGLMFLLFVKAQRQFDQPLINLMYSAAFVGLVSLLGRMVFKTISGTQIPLITDVQMWFFPVLAAILAGVNWMMKKF